MRIAWDLRNLDLEIARVCFGSSVEFSKYTGDESTFVAKNPQCNFIEVASGPAIARLKQYSAKEEHALDVLDLFDHFAVYQLSDGHFFVVVMGQDPSGNKFSGKASSSTLCESICLAALAFHKSINNQR